MNNKDCFLCCLLKYCCFNNKPCIDCEHYLICDYCSYSKNCIFVKEGDSLCLKEK